jgi:hypothetical protein
MTTPIGQGVIYTLLYSFQTLISGVLAIVAAIITAYVVWRSANAPIRATEASEKNLRIRRARFTLSVLSWELRTIVSRARQVRGTIDVTTAANAQVNDDTKQKCYLPRPQMLEDWESMSSLSVGRFESIRQFFQIVDEHNFDIRRAAGAFGEENFRRSLRSRLDLIHKQAANLQASINDELQIVRQEERVHGGSPIRPSRILRLLAKALPRSGKGGPAGDQ